jgi:hypothetical protein
MTNKKIRDQLLEVGVKISKVKAEEVFYTGFYRKNESNGDQEFLESRYAIWLSKSLSYAGEYSYGSTSAPVKRVAKIEILKEIEVLDFPLNFHPADCFFEWILEDGRYNVDYSSVKLDMPFEGYQPDHHFDKYFNEIVSLLGIRKNLSGYIRRATSRDMGFAVGEVKEFALKDYRVMKVSSIVDMPRTKFEFRELVGKYGDKLEAMIFGKVL